jgi:uncharacterized membrane protein
MANKHFRPFLWVVTGCGSLAFIYSALRVDFVHIDSRLALMVGMALLLTSRITIPLPRYSSQISVSDTFVFLVLLLYGSEAAVIVSALEAFLSSLRFSRRSLTRMFNSGSAAFSVMITSSVLQLVFGDIVALRTRPITATFLAAICTMALTQYVANSGIVAIAAAL